MSTIIVTMTDGTTRTFENATVQGIKNGDQYIEEIHSNGVTTHVFPISTISQMVEK